MTATDPLMSAVGALLVQARQHASSSEAAAVLDEARNRLQGPLRVAIAGKVKAGKSTLLNALLGEELAATDAGECTKIVTWYLRGAAPEVIVRPRLSPPQARPFRRDAGAIDVDLGTWSASDVEAIEVHWPTERLRDITLLDTPGIASIRAEISERTQRVLAAEDERPPVADAVLYLLRHTHASDVRFLESFHDDDLAHGTAMNAVGVLSRADEIGLCRLGALEVATRIAERYQQEPRLRRLCPVIVPVAGLLGYAGATLREQEYRALAVLAAAPSAESEELLLTADRFARRPSAVAVTELEREHLLGRLGLFGVRLSVELVRTGAVASASELARELLRRCGMDRLREVLLRQFYERSRVLKARSALTTLDAVLRTGGCADAPRLRSRAEEVTSGAHEFEEVRTLNALRNGDIGINEERTAELDRLLGGSGHAAQSRLALEPTADQEMIRAEASATLIRWQRLAEHPLSSRQVQIAARVAVRTLEGLLLT
jgi:50S ribosome-binding GTPase